MMGPSIHSHQADVPEASERQKFIGLLLIIRLARLGAMDFLSLG